jgi:hypothetical protein
MAKENNSASTENKNWQPVFDDEREDRALEELCDWIVKWQETDLGCNIFEMLKFATGAQKRGRGHPGKKKQDVMSLVMTVAFLEKCGEEEAAAKKIAADRHCMNLRSVQEYFRKHGGEARQIANNFMASGAPLNWPRMARHTRLLEDEVRKLISISLREK